MPNGNVDNGMSHEIGLESQAPSRALPEILPDMVVDQDNYVSQTDSELIPAEKQNDDSDSVARIIQCHRVGSSGKGFFVKRLI